MFEFLLYDLILRIFPCLNFATRYEWTEMFKYLNLEFPHCFSLIHYEESTLPDSLNSTHYIILTALLGHTHFK